MEEENKKSDYKEELTQRVEQLISQILNDEINEQNLDVLSKLVDIHKDLCNEKYWKIKEEVYKMRYNDYGRRGVPGTGRGRYGRRGVPGTGRGRYRGDDPMDEMMENYENYNEAYEDMNNGNYGAEGEMIKSVDGIMKNIYEIVEELSEADTPEVMQIIKKYAKKINEME